MSERGFENIPGLKVYACGGDIVMAQELPDEDVIIWFPPERAEQVAAWILEVKAEIGQGDSGSGDA